MSLHHVLSAKYFDISYQYIPRLDDIIHSMSASHAIGHGFAPPLGHTKDHHKMVQTASLHGT